jgi:2-keto-4-pentenoate hydratase
VASRSAGHRGKGRAANPTGAVREECQEKITASARVRIHGLTPACLRAPYPGMAAVRWLATTASAPS